MTNWKVWLTPLLILLNMACSHSGPGSTKGKDERTGPVFEKLNLFVAGEGGYFCYRVPALVVTTKGTILALCEARKHDCNDWDDIDIVMRRSFDNGKSWQQMQVIAEEGSNSINQPAPVVDRETGTVWLPFCKNNQQVFVIQSRDEGTTWSKPVEITQQVKAPTWHYVGSGPGHGIQLKSGRLLIPSWGDTSPGPVTWAPSANWGKVQFSYTFYSDDHGASWKRGAALESDLSDECQVVETADGRVYMNMRSRQGRHRRAYAWSKDGGVSWSKVEFDERLPEPSCQGSVIRLTDQTHFGRNRVLLTNPASTTERSKLTARVSYDECQTWPVSKVVHEGSSGYSDLAVTSDLMILCLYDADQKFEGKNPYEVGTEEDLRKLEANPTYFANIDRESKLILARFNLQWLTEGNE